MKIFDKNFERLHGGSRIYNTNETQMGRDNLAIEEVYGNTNPVVLMVPVGSIEQEIAMNKELKKQDCITSVISYVNSVGESIPVDFLPEDTVSKLYSENYSRFIINLNTEEGVDGWSDMVDQVRQIGEKYYGDTIKLAGDIVSTEDLKNTITEDNVRVNFLAIAFVFLILLFNFKSISIPIILTLVIETSIWINLAVPYFQSTELHYISYLIISSVQLGATIDYAILFTDRYMEMRRVKKKKDAALAAIKTCILSIFTSAIILTMAGFLLGKISSNLVLSQLGTLIGRGATISFLLVIAVLPVLLLILDPIIQHTTLHAKFYKE